MAFASGAFHGLNYVPEVTYGTTPSTPTMVGLRHTSCSFQLSKDSFQSAELRGDRQIYGHTQGNQKGAGDVGFEFSWLEFDPFLEAALFGAFSTNVLKAGITEKSFTIERAHNDIVLYEVFKGVMVNTFSMSIKPNAIVTGTFGLISKTVEPISATPLDAAPTASQSELPYDSFAGTLEEGGSAIASITSLELSLQNGLEQLFAIGSRNAVGLSVGRSNLTGTVSCFFESEAMYNKFVNGTVSSLELVLGNGTTKSYTFLIPRIVYTGGDRPVSGEGPVTLNMPFQALYDSTTGTNFQITRTAS